MQKSKLTPMGKRIAAGMLAAGLHTESSLARRLGVSHQTVRRWLYEPLTRIEANTLFRIADALNLSARWIVSGDGSPTARIPLTPTTALLIDMHNALSSSAQSILLHVAADLTHANTA